MARNLTTQVPWILCHDHTQCTAVNRAPDGTHVDKALCTINGFWMEEHVKDHSQPSPAWLADLRKHNPGQPAIWTEDQGWFDQWGVAMRVRDPADQSYGIGRFFAYGGAWHNFYMLTGGNNYGRQAGGISVTGYAPDVAIDYLLLRHEPRFSHYRALFRTLANYSNDLLSHPIATPTPLAASGNTTTFLTLQPCTDADPAHVGKLDASQQWALGTDSALRNEGSGLCVTALPTKFDQVTLKPCEGIEHTPSLRWTYNTSSKQYVSAVTVPCESSHSQGRRCHRCLDIERAGSRVDSSDCKKPGDATINSQRWQPFTPKAGGSGIRGAVDGLCLTATTVGGGGADAHTYGGAFLSNYDESATLDVHFGARSQPYHLPNHTVVIVDRASGAVVWNSTNVWAHAQSLPAAPQPGGVSFSASWSVFVETPGYGARTRTANAPLEMLAVTSDDSDYLWYSAHVFGQSASPHVSAPGDNGALTYVYVNGQARLEMEATDELAVAADGPGGQVGVQLDILACAMGMPNVDVGPHSMKGLQEPVTVDGVDVSSKGKSAWTHSWMLRGEAQQIYTPGGAASVEWTALTPDVEANATIAWFKGSFDMPTAAPSATQTSYALDLSTMNKGVAYVNGFNIGRYWLQPGKCSGTCPPPVKSGHCYMHWKGCSRPTQTLYHVPQEVLQPTGNLVLLFEETANSVQRRDLSGVLLRALHEHPPFD